MGRTILAVVAGYLAMVAFVFASFSGLYYAMGADRAFLPGLYEPSMAWIATTLVLGIIAAMLGGFVCASIDSSPRAVPALAILVAVVGLAMAASTMTRTDTRPTVRDGSVSNSEAMMNARQPFWVSIAFPVIGAVGVWIGGHRRRRTGAS
jgi:hypothetical protein